MEKILQEILDIKPGNEFLSYIVGRVTQKDYRGTHKSQHNRYTIDDLEVILRAVHDIVGDKEFLVPPGDMTGSVVQDEARSNYSDYVAIVDKVHQKIDRVTMNSLKKNFFVDFSRMGFIEKYDSGGNLLNPFERTRTEKIKISPEGLDLLNAGTLFEKHKIFTDGVVELLGDALVDLVSAIDLSDFRKGRFSFEEYTLIFSDDSLDGVEKIFILGSWRLLSRGEQEKALSLIKKYCVPESFDGNKSDKRDYHNWRNETQQLMQLFKATIYFQVYDNQFSLNTGKEFGIFEVSRSESVKSEYFKEHEIEKEEYYELHHIVPLSYVKNKEEYKLIDDCKNLIYLHKDKHKEIKRDYIRFRDKDPKIYFVNIFKDSEVVTARNGKNAKFNPSLLPTIRKYNKEIIKSILDIS